MTISRTFSVVLALCAVFASAAVIAGISGNDLRFPDEEEYHQLGASIASGRGFSNSDGAPTAKRPPGWPALLSVVYQVVERPIAAKIVNATLLTATAFLLYLLVRISQPSAGILPIFIVLFYPLFQYTAGTLYTQTFGSFLFILSIFLLLSRPDSIRTLIFASFVYGILILTVPAFLLLAPIVALYLFFTNHNKSVSRLKIPAIYIVVICLVVTPWTLRNYLIFKTLMPVSSNSGINLYLGNSERATANSGVSILFDDQETYPEGLDELAEDEFFKKKAIDWIKSHPLDAVFLYFKKVVNYFNFRNQLFQKSEASSTNDLILFFTYYPLLSLAVIRIFLFRIIPFDRVEALLYALYFGNAFASAVFFTRIRFRIPFDFLLIAAVAIFLTEFWTRWKPDRDRAAGREPVSES